MGAAQKLATFDQMFAAIGALPEGQHGEILGPGVWRTMSRPGASHRRASKRVASRLGSMDLDAGGAWWLEVEAELRLDDRLYVPDLAGWRVPDGDLAFTEVNPITRTPDWVCEILSRTTQRADRVIKLPTYAKAGVAHVWVIDTEAGTIEVYTSVHGLPTLVATAVGAPTRLPPFDLEIDVQALLALPAR